MKGPNLKVTHYTAIQRIFLQSPVNGGHYDGEDLPLHKRLWPRQTFLQLRLAQLAVQASEER